MSTRKENFHPQPYLLLESESHKYVFLTNKNTLCSVSDKDFQKLVKKEKQLNRFSPLQNYIFKQKTIKEQRKRNETGKCVVTINYSTNCNLNCSYCYKCKTQTGKLGKEELRDIVRYVKEVYRPKAKQYVFCMGYTSEPLLERKTLEDFKELIGYEDMSKQMMWFVSNGTLINQENVEFLKSLNITYFGVSIDGTEEIHNFSRKYRNGTGSYKDTVAGIKLLQKNGIDVLAGVVFSPKYPFPQKVINHLVSLGVKEVNFQIARTAGDSRWTEEKIADLLKDFDRLFAQMKAEFLLGDFHLLAFLKNCFIGDILKSILKHNLISSRCSWGDAIAIDTKGDIYNCNYTIGNKNDLMGNYKDARKSKKMNNIRNVNNIKDCKDCRIKYLCGGTCYYENMIHKADRYNIECEYRKGLIERTLYLYIFMHENGMLKRLIEIYQ